MVIKYIFYLILNIIELCCFNCIFKNLHKGHKLIEISDEDTLQKENLTIESSTKEYLLNRKIVNRKIVNIHDYSL